jgi:NAD(P)H-hydrate epimerase
LKIQGTALLNTRQIRECENFALSTLGISQVELMESAGLAAFMFLKKQFPSAHKIVVFCGSGNNGGDGYVLARLAQEADYSVVIHQYKSLDQLTGAAFSSAELAYEAGIPMFSLDEPIENDTDLIVDALLGTGLAGMVAEPLANAIHQINDSGLPILAIDIPSGLEADTGLVQGVCTKATCTVTFIALKRGMMTLDGPDYCGEINCQDLNLGLCLSKIKSEVMLLGSKNLKKLKDRPKNCHKGDFGKVLIIGGNEGMPGAVSLAANAALRVGAGLVTVALKPQYASSSLPGLPEALIYGLEEAKDLIPLIKKASVCLIGPGLGTDSWATQLFSLVIAAQLPMVIDASALRILAKNPQHDDTWILTPHPGEAAELLHSPIEVVQKNRFKAALDMQNQYGGQIVLKGVGTVIATDEPMTYVCSAGNPGMATGGMGDVLSGVIAGLIAQGLSLAEAATFGVWLHAQAADLAIAKTGPRGLLPSDLMPFLRGLVN